MPGWRRPVELAAWDRVLRLGWRLKYDTALTL